MLITGETGWGRVYEDPALPVHFLCKLKTALKKISVVLKKSSRRLCRNWHADSKIYVEIQRTWICQDIHKSELQTLTLPDSQLSCKATVTRTVWCWCKDSWAHEWKRIESSEIDPQCSQCTRMGKGTSSQPTVLEQLGITWKKRTLTPYSIPHTNKEFKMHDRS